MFKPAGTEQTAVGGDEHSGGRLQQAQRTAASARRVSESPAEGERVRMGQKLK